MLERKDVPAPLEAGGQEASQEGRMTRWPLSGDWAACEATSAKGTGRENKSPSVTSALTPKDGRRLPEIPLEKGEAMLPEIKILPSWAEKEGGCQTLGQGRLGGC